MNVHHNLNTVHRGTDIWIQRHRWHPVDQWSRWQWSTAGINDAIIRRRWWLQSHTHRHKRRWALHMVRYSTLGCWRHCLRFPILTLTMCITVRNKYHKFVTGNGANNNDYTPSQPPLRPYTPLLSVPEVNRFPMEETDPLVSVTY